MALAQTIIDNAYAKSAAARFEQTAAPAELLARIGQALREWALVMSRENPYLLGERALVAFAVTGWPRPDDCIRVIDVRATSDTVSGSQLAPGTRITVVPFDDLSMAAGVPALTEFGQQFIPTGGALDPSNGTLEVLYARSPILPETTQSPIDPLFPAWGYDFLQFDLAAYLASKEERKADEEVFYGGKNAMMSALVEWARQQTYSLVQRFPVVNPPLINVQGGRPQAAGGAS
jgi:hypothetical protein